MNDAQAGNAMTESPAQLPAREPVLRVVPMPADVNQHGDIFGGWIMAQVDIAGGVVAARQARGRVATVAVNSCLQCSRICSTVRLGSLRTTNTFTASPALASGTPMHAHSSTPGHEETTSSTSFGYTLKPETMIMSFLRSTIFT